MARTRRISIIIIFTVTALFGATFLGSQGATMAGPGGCCPISQRILK